MTSEVCFLHQLNAFGALVGALLLNGFLLALICTQTPKEMNEYRNILLQTCVIDLATAVLEALNQPVFKMKRKIL